MHPLGKGCQVVKPAWTKGLLAIGTDSCQPELVGPLQVTVADGGLVAGEDLVQAGDGRLAQAGFLLHAFMGVVVLLYA